MLRRWDCCRHGIRHSIYILESRAPCTIDGEEAPRRHRHDHAQAISLSVCHGDHLTVRFSSPGRYQGHVGAALVLGGVDSTGPHLFTIHPHGSTDKLPYVTMGSGSLAAMAVFEKSWKPNMDVCS